MNADEHGCSASGLKRFRLGTLLLLSPLLALVVVLCVWVATLRSQIASLEARLAKVEMLQSLNSGYQPISNVGVPLDIDEAMLMDNAIPNGMPLLRRIR